MDTGIQDDSKQNWHYWIQIPLWTLKTTLKNWIHPGLIFDEHQFTQASMLGSKRYKNNCWIYGGDTHPCIWVRQAGELNTYHVGD